jgi:hypothetical protein
MILSYVVGDVQQADFIRGGCGGDSIFICEDTELVQLPEKSRPKGIVYE